MPARRDSDGLPDIYESMKHIFTDALTNERSHTRNSAALFALHRAVVCRGIQTDCGAKEGGYEFMECFLYFLGQCLHMKAARPADFGLRFVAAYIEYLNDSVGQVGHDYLQFYPQDRGEPGPSSSVPGSSSSSTPGPSSTTPSPTHDPAPWFTGRVLKALRHALAAPTKQIRRRAIDTVSRMFGTLGAIDARVVDKVRAEVRERLADKDRVVRARAAALLYKHMAAEGEARLIDAEDGGRLIDAEDEALLIEAMACDPAVDVRLVVVSYIPITENTVPHLLLRSRDDGRDEKSTRKGGQADARVRVAVYRRLRENIAVEGARRDGAAGDARPNAAAEGARPNGAIVDKLNGTVIDRLLAYGFDDRSEDVQRAVAKLVACSRVSASRRGSRTCASWKCSSSRVVKDFLSARPSCARGWVQVILYSL
ncbi:uncharacterized protein SCHCODRAFT_0237707 [Schizophyllum commune H4-8]|uniref:Uncharacterized protein n=1 Tax=Schizophyllum commune (strain H4-8 / FGSC 9210) TaxID=578458 RepID=D8QGW7_SCHCM|nr:uncharacterized protein SCHCODRAFT_0237707 [Schizophyllum commune H4-8]KAI5886925.1 hypothetical protein SCHCODRAFT_0237707 [Schizophyllum commune H4-8]